MKQVAEKKKKPNYKTLKKKKPYNYFKRPDKETPLICMYDPFFFGQNIS